LVLLAADLEDWAAESDFCNLRTCGIVLFFSDMGEFFKNFQIRKPGVLFSFWSSFWAKWIDFLMPKFLYIAVIRGKLLHLI
jgi:hypothetical protein